MISLLPGGTLTSALWWFRTSTPSALAYGWRGVDALLLTAFVLASSWPAPYLTFTQHYLVGMPLVFTLAPGAALLPRALASPTPRVAGMTDAETAASIVLLETYNLHAGMVVTVRATAYSSTPDQTSGDPFITASGTRVHPGTVATNFLPFGTIVRIDGAAAVVEDRMHPRYDGQLVIDIWQPTREQAAAFGAQWLPVEIVALP